MACHCRGCQKLTGSAFSLSVAFVADAFEITQGKPVIGALHKDDARYWYCDWCKSWLYTEPPSEVGFVNVRTTMLDDPKEWDPFIEVCTDEMLSWAQTPARYRFAKQPPMEAFAGLIAEFAELRS